MTHSSLSMGLIYPYHLLRQNLQTSVYGYVRVFIILILALICLFQLFIWYAISFFALK
jgi:hypothetical protein